MTNIKKRPRGRPKGTGKNDLPVLQQVADLMARDPSLKKTTAIKRVLAKRPLQPGEMETTVVRRLQQKWTAEGTSLLRHAEARREAVTAHAGVGGHFSRSPGAFDRLVDDVLRAVEMERDLERMLNPFGSPVGRLSDMLKGTRMPGNYSRIAEDILGTEKTVDEAHGMQRALAEAYASASRIESDIDDLTRAARAAAEFAAIGRFRW